MFEVIKSYVLAMPMKILVQQLYFLFCHLLSQRFHAVPFCRKTSLHAGKLNIPGALKGNNSPAEVLLSYAQFEFNSAAKFEYFIALIVRIQRFIFKKEKHKDPSFMLKTNTEKQTQTD